MTVLFKITNQIIERTDNQRVVARSLNYLKAKFTFSEDWTGYKTAIFSRDESNYGMLLDDSDECYIPHEVLENEGEFSVSVVCGDRITANKEYIYVEQTGYIPGETPDAPTPDIYEQIIEAANDTAEMATEAMNEARSVRRDADEGKFDGKDGASSYEIAVAAGYTGTEEEWLASLKGEPGTTDYLKLLNKPIIDIDIAGITDFYFREQIPGSAKSPCFYRIVSSDESVYQIENVYLDENHRDELVYEYLTVGDTFFVFDVFDETSDGYQLLAFPLVRADSMMQFLYLCTIGDEAVQKIYYAPLSTYEQLVQMITNLNDYLNDLKTQEKLDIEQLQSQTEQKLSTKANKVSWRKIFEITTTKKVSVVEQSVDSNGKPFKLSQARIIISVPSHSGISEVVIDQPAVAYHPETDTDWYSLYGDSIGKSQDFLIFEIKAEPFVFGELTTMPNGSGFLDGAPLDKNTASVCCGGRYDIDYIDYFKLQDTLNADATFPANTKITMWGIDKDD